MVDAQWLMLNAQLGGVGGAATAAKGGQILNYCQPSSILTNAR
jgi:hypothetical protein